MKIYIHVIEGTETWMPATVKKVADGEFEIAEFKDFDPLDNSLVPQFLPGDIVALRTQKKDESDECLVADKLIRPSPRLDKKYFEFLYRTITGDKLKNATERYEFRHVIERIRAEIENDAKNYYPVVENYVKGVKAIIK